MTVSVKELRGSTPTLAEKLKESGVGNNEQLLAAAATPAQRKVLAASCGCDARVILELANRADLARIKGVSGVYSDLLEKAGVDTVKELATLVTLAFTGTRTIAHLIARNNGGASFADILEEALGDMDDFGERS